MRRLDKENKGSATVEFALAVALLMAPLLLGLVDFGRYLHVKQIVSRAAHEGVLLATRDTDPGAVVRNAIAAAGLDSGKASLALAPAIGTAATGEQVQLTVSYDLNNYALVSWGDMFPQGVSVKAVARHE